MNDRYKNHRKNCFSLGIPIFPIENARLSEAGVNAETVADLAKFSVHGAIDGEQGVVCSIQSPRFFGDFCPLA